MKAADFYIRQTETNLRDFNARSKPDGTKQSSWMRKSSMKAAD